MVMEYNPITNEIISELKNIVGDKYAILFISVILKLLYFRLLLKKLPKLLS